MALWLLGLFRQMFALMVATVAVMSIGITLTKPVSTEAGKNIALPENVLLMHDRYITSAAAWLLITLCSAALGMICNLMTLVIA